MAVFQFPSNGKDFPNAKRKRLAQKAEVLKRVSIPFKREGLSELETYHAAGVWKKVSIPFKREGLSELTWSAEE